MTDDTLNPSLLKNVDFGTAFATYIADLMRLHFVVLKCGVFNEGQINAEEWSVLYAIKNDGDSAVDLQKLSHVTGLSKKRLSRIVTILRTKDFLEAQTLGGDASAVTPLTRSGETALLTASEGLQNIGVAMKGTTAGSVERALKLNGRLAKTIARQRRAARKERSQVLITGT